MLFFIALISLVLVVACFLEISLGMRTMTQLEDVSVGDEIPLPKVSVIIPACNEGATIEPALRSVLDIDYPHLEIVVVNDRSTDNTGAIIKQLQCQFPRIQTIEISELPENWLGKSHAQQVGADYANGEYLLFTDADILMEKTTLRRALNHMLNNSLDHLSIFFGNIAPGGLLNAIVVDLGVGLLLLLKPWRARDPMSKYFMGVGAFNLVKASAYRAIGGHSSFSMHPIDDIMLGKTLKQNKFRQDCLLGNKFIQVKWYGSIRDLVSGVMKNTFAAYDFNVFRVTLGVLLVGILSIFPLWALFLSTGITQVLFCAIVLIRIISFGLGFWTIGLPIWYAAWSLISPYINCYIVLKATITTLANNGITWRGTHYPLAKLKQHSLF